MENGDTLFNLMSDAEVADLKVKYPDNQSIVALADGILATREREATQARAMANFTKGIDKTFAKLPHPDSIHNIYARWGEVDVEEGEPEAVEVVVTPAEVNEKGNITTPAVTATEMRCPTIKAMAWIVEVNHATKVTSGSTPGQPKTSKRAITVYKRNGTQLELQGNYISASKACDALKLIVGGDSATRVLSRDGYITEPYEGAEYTS